MLTQLVSISNFLETLQKKSQSFKALNLAASQSSQYDSLTSGGQQPVETDEVTESEAEQNVYKSL